jgi:F-type H+-transporting ATPase subunit a
MTFLITNLTANKTIGHIFWMPGVPKLMRIVLAPIELLGVLAIFINDSSIRKHFAGHIVLMSIIGLMFIFKSWLGSTLSFGLSFALSILEILHSYRLIFSHCYQRFILCCSRRAHHEEHINKLSV